MHYNFQKAVVVCLRILCSWEMQCVQCFCDVRYIKWLHQSSVGVFGDKVRILRFVPFWGQLLFTLDDMITTSSYVSVQVWHGTQIPFLIDVRAVLTFTLVMVAVLNTK